MTATALKECGHDIGAFWPQFDCKVLQHLLLGPPYPLSVMEPIRRPDFEAALSVETSDEMIDLSEELFGRPHTILRRHDDRLMQAPEEGFAALLCKVCADVARRRMKIVPPRDSFRERLLNHVNRRAL